MGGVQTMERPSIRVLIVEREPLVWHGLIACLVAEQSIEVVGNASSADAGYRLVDKLQPDVLLLGTTLEDAPGLAATFTFRRYYPSIAIIVVGIRESDDEIFEAIRAGASAYCGQDVDEQQLVELIRRVETGQFVINEQLLARPNVAARVLAWFRSSTVSEASPTSASAPLTNRELEFLRKLPDNDRTRAVMTALRRGWLSLDDQTAPRAGTDAVAKGDVASDSTGT